MVRLCVWWSGWRRGRRTGVGQADEDDLRLHAKVLGARIQRRLERVPRVQAAAHMHPGLRIRISLIPKTVHLCSTIQVVQAARRSTAGDQSDFPVPWSDRV